MKSEKEASFILNALAYSLGSYSRMRHTTRCDIWFHGLDLVRASQPSWGSQTVTGVGRPRSDYPGDGAGRWEKKLGGQGFWKAELLDIPSIQPNSFSSTKAPWSACA